MNNMSLFSHRNFIYFILSLLLSLFILIPIRANADGRNLLTNCEVALAFLEGRDLAQYADARAEEFMTCPGYVQGFTDLNYQYQGMLGKGALFCLPEKKIDRTEGMRIVVEYLRSNEAILGESDTYIVSAAFSTKYPCVPLMKKK